MRSRAARSSSNLGSAGNVVNLKGGNGAQPDIPTIGPSLLSKALTIQRPRSAAPRLLDQVRAKIRVKHYSLRTEEASLDWIKRFVLFHGKRRPSEHADTLTTNEDSGVH